MKQRKKIVSINGPPPQFVGASNAQAVQRQLENLKKTGGDTAQQLGSNSTSEIVRAHEQECDKLLRKSFAKVIDSFETTRARKDNWE